MLDWMDVPVNGIQKWRPKRPWEDSQLQQLAKICLTLLHDNMALFYNVFFGRSN